jgi:nucleotide-binding universal stress UspA family protein
VALQWRTRAVFPVSTPLLTVNLPRAIPREKELVPMLQVQRILVPVDFTDTTEVVIEYAVGLAQRMGSSITILHAYQIPVYGFPDGAFITAAEVAAQLSTAAQAHLDALQERYNDRGPPVTTVLRDGVAWEEINAVAADLSADLIIIGTHGRRGLARALLGSVAENIIRTANIPVLVIHGPRDAQ